MKRPLGSGHSRRGLLLGLGGLAAGLGGGGSADAANLRRIVSIGGALTETLYALGAQAEVVGVDTTSLYPASAQRLPSVGYARALSAEGVLSLSPTIVVATEEAGPPAVMRQIEAANVPVQVLPSDHRYEGVLSRTATLALLTRQEAAGTALNIRLRSEWLAAMERVAAVRTDKPLRVMFVMSHALGQARVAGRDTGADAMLAYAGAVNVIDVASGFSGYKPLSPESVIAAAPDVILTTEQSVAAAGGAAGLLKLPGMAQTPAGRAQRIVAMDALWLLGFGPRLPQAVATLADALHRPADVSRPSI